MCAPQPKKIEKSPVLEVFGDLLMEGVLVSEKRAYEKQMLSWRNPGDLGMCDKWFYPVL
jgi:hypothetical protein